MSQSPRVVAELGRPETPDETAARKAESSRIYRSSQTTRNLIAALLATLAVVAIVVFGVPRGEIPAAAPIDVAAVAQGIESTQNGPVIAPVFSDYWIVNRAGIEDVGGLRAWTIVIAPADEDKRGFLRVAQGFDADPAWSARVLSGAAVVGEDSAGGVVWERYEVNPARAANVSVALAATVGTDTVLVYGTATDDELEEVAADIADQILTIRQDAP